MIVPIPSENKIDVPNHQPDHCFDPIGTDPPRCSSGLAILSSGANSDPHGTSQAPIAQACYDEGSKIYM